MGLGKTIQTIALLGYLNLKSNDITHLIIVPKVTIKNWEIEIHKWLPKKNYYFSMEIKMKEFEGSKIRKIRGI